MKSYRQQVSEWSRESYNRIREMLAEQVICDRCGTTFDTINDACTARIFNDQCPGQKAVEAADISVRQSLPMPSPRSAHEPRPTPSPSGEQLMNAEPADKPGPGRPALSAEAKKSRNLTFRTRGGLREQLTLSAKENGRSTSEEIEARLKNSFQSAMHASAITWRAMFSAPRDGTPIIAIWPDFSSVEIIYCAYAESKGDKIDGMPCWYSFFGGVITDISDTDLIFAGWIPMPEGTPLFEPERLRRLKEWGGLTMPPEECP